MWHCDTAGPRITLRGMARGRNKPRPLDEAELYSYALKALAARARSAGEMRRLLARRALEPTAVETVLARLAGRGYLDDERFSQNFASWRLENQRFGRGRVLRDLRSRRVSGEVAERAVSQVYADVDETALLREQLARRLRGHPPPSEVNKLASLYRSLRRAGFSHAPILAELRRARADAKLLDRLQEEEDTPPENE